MVCSMEIMENSMEIEKIWIMIEFDRSFDVWDLLIIINFKQSTTLVKDDLKYKN